MKKQNPINQNEEHLPKNCVASQNRMAPFQAMRSWKKCVLTFTKIQLMKVLLDTDVILDLVLERQPFVTDAESIWNANSQGLYEGYVSAITPINVHYFVRKFKDAKVADQVVQEILNNFQICPVDYIVLQADGISDIKDFEDAVQHSSAQGLGLDAIVTRNIKDYSKASLQIFFPPDFLEILPI